MVSFDKVPPGLRIPGVYLEIDGSKAAGLQSSPFRALVVGQKTSAGTATVLKPTLVTSADQARTLFGAGSALWQMIAAFKANNPWTECWAVALADPGGGTAAARLETISGTATEAGTIAVYVGGTRLEVGVAVGDDADAVRDALVTLITATTDLPVTAAAEVGAGELTITHKHLGAFGTGLVVRTGYYDTDKVPAGLTVSMQNLAGGAGAVDLTTVWPVLGDVRYHVIATPYTDATALAAIDEELEDRWGPLRQIPGVAFTGSGDTLGNLQTLGSAQNSKHTPILATTKSPTPAYVVAAGAAAVAAYHGAIDPARPFQTLAIKAALPPRADEQLTDAERNLLLFDGIATLKAGPGGTYQIERLITTYQMNAAGGTDTAFLDVNTHLTLDLLREEVRNLVLVKFPRHKLGKDGKRYAPGQAIVTPGVIAGELSALAASWEERALIEDAAAFEEQLVVEISALDPNRLDIELPPDLVNQLRVTAAKVSFRL